MTVDCVYGWTDEKIRACEDLASMRSMILYGDRVDDSTMELLADHCVNLKELHLLGANLTDRGFEHVGRIKSLDWIVIDETPVTDRGIKHLAFLTGLKGLHLVRTCITEDGLDVLFHFPSLKYFEAAGDSLGNRGLSTISQVNGLEILRLASPFTSDRDFLSLAFSPSLRMLTVDMPNVSRDAIRQMGDRLQGCLVSQLAIHRSLDEVIYRAQTAIQLIRKNLIITDGKTPTLEEAFPPDARSEGPPTNKLSLDQVRYLIAAGLLEPNQIIEQKVIRKARKAGEEPIYKWPGPEELLLDLFRERKAGREKEKDDKLPWSW
ncbi:MAG: hypothetical protein KC777_06340 [Cyanobacteria bacterium HKST-UBA02]|nr:hypothetical protein [Cyanobacteria bacterium HKST-UBA02]